MKKRSRKRTDSVDQSVDAFADYVEHPRYGRSPRYTGLDVDRCDLLNVHLHWINGPYSEEFLDALESVLGWRPSTYDDGTRSIPGTAVPADLSKQVPATVPITHYYDLDKKCRKCGRRFIFFAVEQKYWYEKLKLTLNANAVHCTSCRKDSQRIERTRRRYEELFHLAGRSSLETIEMADCCLFLMEEDIFSKRQCQTVRMLLNDLGKDRERITGERKLRARLEAIEKRPMS